MNEGESAGAPAEAVVGDVEEVVEAEADTSEPAQLAATPVDGDPDADASDAADAEAAEDAEAAKKAAESGEKARLDKILGEMVLLSNSTLNKLSKETRDRYDTLTTDAERREYLIENPGAEILTEIDLIRTLTPDRLAELVAKGPVAFDTADPPYVIGEKKLGKLVSIDGDNFTCTVSGSTEVIPVPRNELVAIAIGSNIDKIMKNFPDGSPQHKLFELYFDALTPGTELTAEQIAGIPELIVATAEANGITTTGTLLRAGETFYKAQEIPDGTSPEDSAQIMADNADKAAKLELLNKQLAGNSLATVEQIKGVMETIGLDQPTIVKKLARAREDIPLLEKALRETTDKAVQDRLKAQLDTTRATAEIYEAIQSKISDATVSDYIESQQNGTVSADLGKQINQAIEENDIAALVLMVSPESSITATAQQKAEARKHREDYNKKLKTVGTIAALAALLLALGISQGAKQ